MAKVWELASILRGHDLPRLFRDSPWQITATEIEIRFASAVDVQDRQFLDDKVPDAMLIYGAAVAGILGFRADNGYLRSREPGEPVALSWIIANYGSALAEELLEKGLVSEPLSG